MQKNNKIIIWVLVLAVIVLAYVVIKDKAVAPVVPEPPVIDNTMPPIPKERLEGNKNDLISFSIWPGTKVHGVVSYRGIISGGYFFEGNILVSVLDANKNLLKGGNAVATTEWMTAGPVSFEGNIDFSGLPNGPAYILIQNDDPSDGEGGPPKKIFIPIIIDNPIANTYTYKNHGFTIELPKGFVPKESDSEGGPYTTITLPEGNGVLGYLKDLSWWEKYDAPIYTYLGTEKIGTTTFLLYKYNDTEYPNSDQRYFIYKQGNVGYMFNVNDKNRELLKTFKFVGWSQ